MTIGEYVKRYCKLTGITYQQFADMCSVSKGYISMLINGKNPKTGRPIKPTIETYMAIARATNISIDELFERIDDAPVLVRAKKPKRLQIDNDLGNGESPVFDINYDGNDGIWQRREALRRDPKRRVLFDLAENGTQKDIDAAIALLDALRATNPDFYDGDDPA